MLTIWGGWDEREANGFDVCEHSIRSRSTQELEIIPLVKEALRDTGLYTRPEHRVNGRLWDGISEQYVSTDFSLSRFLPITDTDAKGWSLFCDFADMAFIHDVADLFALADPQYAVMCVKHQHVPDQSVKMDNQVQYRYRRKNWSSVMLINHDHQANRRLTVGDVNTRHRDWLHGLEWLADHEIGSLPMAWNYLVGVQPETTPIHCLHYTLGPPCLPGCKNGPMADIWLREHAAMMRCRDELRMR